MHQWGPYGNITHGVAEQVSLGVVIIFGVLDHGNWLLAAYDQHARPRKRGLLNRNGWVIGLRTYGLL